MSKVPNLMKRLKPETIETFERANSQAQLRAAASSPVTFNPKEDAFYQAIEKNLPRPKPHNQPCDCMECGALDKP